MRLTQALLHASGSATMRLSELLPHLDSLAPCHLAADWDNVGLIVGDTSRSIERILVTNDTSIAVVQEAQAAGAELILSYHPPYLRAPQQLLASHPVWHAIRANISIYSPHTAWDAAPGGVNDCLADAAGIMPGPGRSALHEGMGRVGELSDPSSFEALVARVKRGMKRSFALVAQPPGLTQIKRVAVAAGAGGSLLDAALAQRAQVLVTGEMRHHDTLRAVTAGMAVVCLTHSGSERASLAALAKQVTAIGAQNQPQGLVCTLSQADAEPLVLA